MSQRDLNYFGGLINIVTVITQIYLYSLSSQGLDKLKWQQKTKREVIEIAQVSLSLINVPKVFENVLLYLST